MTDNSRIIKLLSL